MKSMKDLKVKKKIYPPLHFMPFMAVWWISLTLLLKTKNLHHEEHEKLEG